MDKFVHLSLPNIIKNHVREGKIEESSMGFNCSEEREKAVKQWSFIRQLNIHCNLECCGSSFELLFLGLTYR